MAAHSFEDLEAHVGHRVTVARYGQPGDGDNVAIECEDCSEVLLDFDRDPPAPGASAPPGEGAGDGTIGGPSPAEPRRVERGTLLERAYLVRARWCVTLVDDGHSSERGDLVNFTPERLREAVLRGLTARFAAAAHSGRLMRPLTMEEVEAALDEGLDGVEVIEQRVDGELVAGPIVWVDAPRGSA